MYALFWLTRTLAKDSGAHYSSLAGLRSVPGCYRLLIVTSIAERCAVDRQKHEQPWAVFMGSAGGVRKPVVSLLTCATLLIFLSDCPAMEPFLL